MADHAHRHPHATASVSLLRMSIAGRLLVAGLCVAAIWAAVFWAMS